MIDIAKYVKQLRGKFGLTQTAFGLRIGKTRTTIAKYESGKVVPPGNILLKIQELEKKLANKKSAPAV